VRAAPSQHELTLLALTRISFRLLRSSNQYDTDPVTFSPQGRLFQIECTPRSPAFPLRRFLCQRC
jgi:hypothetical protein